MRNVNRENAANKARLALTFLMSLVIGTCDTKAIYSVDMLQGSYFIDEGNNDRQVGNVYSYVTSSSKELLGDSKISIETGSGEIFIKSHRAGGGGG